MTKKLISYDTTTGRLPEDVEDHLSASIAEALDGFEGGVSQGDLDALAATLPATLKRVLDPISNPNTSQGGGNQRTSRWVRTLPVSTTRWRLRCARRTAYGTVTSATAVSVGMYVGAPETGTGQYAGYSGNFTAAPTQAVPAFTAPADGSDYVSPWVTDPALQFKAGVSKLCSIGYTFGDGDVPADYGRGWWLGTTAANAADQNSNYGYVPGSFPMDVRIEYETVTDRTIGLTIGTSLCTGFKVTNAGISVDETFPQIAAATNGRSVAANAAIGSSKMVDFGTDRWGWQRLQIGAVTPQDYAIVEFSNDVLDAGDGITLAAIQTAVGNMVKQLRTAGVKRVFLCTPAPRPAATSAVVGTTTTATTAGATTLSLTYNPGTVPLVVGVGFNYEEVTATAVSGSGPYSVTVPALSKPHPAGTLVRSGVERVRQQVLDWMRGPVPFDSQAVFDWDALLSVGVGGWDMDQRYKGDDGIHFRPITHSLLARLGGA